MNPAPPPNEQIVLAFYNAARSEVVQRLALREQTLLAWIGTMGVVIGFSVDKNGGFIPELIRLVPLMSPVFAMLVHRHVEIIHHLGEYIKDLGPHLGQASGNLYAGAPSHWDNSDPLHENLSGFLFREIFIITMAEVLVPVACICYLWRHGHNWCDPWVAFGILAIAFVIGLAGFDLHWEYKSRKR